MGFIGKVAGRGMIHTRSRRLVPRGLRAGRRIGLLGGSFDPAHAGHLHAARLALRMLRLHEVWFLVSPGNPLKPSPTASFEHRMAGLRALIDRHPRLRASDVERQMGTRYTADTLDRLRRVAPATRFVWIMGSDGLASIHRWRRWTRIFGALPIAVVVRPSWPSGVAVAARRFAWARLPRGRVDRLVEARPPCWTVLRGRLASQSSSAIRGRS